MNEIKVFKKEVYGRMLYYFLDKSSNEAKIIKELLGQKTLNKEQYQMLKALGLELKLVAQEDEEDVA